MFEDLEWLPTSSYSLHTYGEPYTADSSEAEDGSEGENRPETNWTININEIPQEIIRDILEIASDDADNSISFVFCASLVCKYWKALAFSAPKLWGRLDAERPRDMIKNFLKRSNRAPLDIWIYLNPMIDESEGKSRIQWFTALISLERYRFRSLTFHFYYPSWFEAGFSLLTSQPTMAIDSLDVRRLQFSSPSMELDDTTVDADRITLIPHQLRCDGIHLSSSLNAGIPMFSGSLITLDLNWHKNATCVDPLLAGASNLEYLRLAGFWYSTNRDLDGRPPQRLQSLREIALDRCETYSRFLFYNLETPSLERLLLNLVWDGQLEEALTTVVQHNPQLQRLHIKFSCHLQRLEWKPVFSALPSLTHLSLSDYGDESSPPGNWSLDCLIADPTSPQSALCPNLSSIAFNRIESVSSESVVGLVKSRMATPGVSPIKSLKWTWVNWHDAANIHKAIGGMVPNMVLECVDMATLKDDSEQVMLLEEEWVPDDWNRWSDSGDE